MTYASTLRAFYNRDHWGQGFGNHNPLDGGGIHHGFDINGHPAHEPVPAIRSGRVVFKWNSTILGRVIVVRHGRGMYDGYAHVIRRARLGTKIVPGKIIGKLAGPSDPHGTAWRGVHLHLTRGSIVRSIFGLAVIDPKPVVVAALRAAA
jgi:murein DD-endopeptidase MepM/ murein hydrolase activator NlpD